MLCVASTRYAAKGLPSLALSRPSFRAKSMLSELPLNHALPAEERQRAIQSVVNANVSTRRRFKNKPGVSVCKKKAEGTNRALALIRALDKAQAERAAQPALLANEPITIDLKRINEQEQTKFIVKQMAFTPTTFADGVPENAELVAPEPKAADETKGKPKAAQNQWTTENIKLDALESSAEKDAILSSGLVHPEGFFVSLANTIQRWTNCFPALYHDSRYSIYLAFQKMNKGREISEANEVLHMRKNKADVGKALFSAIVTSYYPPSLLLIPAIAIFRPTWLPSMLLSKKKEAKLEVQREKAREKYGPIVLQNFKDVAVKSFSSSDVREFTQLGGLLEEAHLKEILSSYSRDNPPGYADLTRLTPWFSTNYTLGHLSSASARTMARFLNLPFPFLFPRARILSHFSKVVHDDAFILRSKSPLAPQHVHAACALRQIPWHADVEVMRKQLLAHARFTAALTTPQSCLTFVLARALRCNATHAGAPAPRC